MTTQYSVKMVITGAAQSALKAIEGVRGSLQRLNRLAVSSNMALKMAKMGRAMGSVRQQALNLYNETFRLGARFVGLGVAGAGALGLLIKPASEMENLRVRLEGLMGSSVRATQALDMLKKFAVESPYSFTALADAMNTLQGQGIDGLGKDYKDIMRYLGSRIPNQERASNAVLAISQAWGLAKLQMGDIRQMSQAGIPVWELLGKVTGKNTAQLQAMSSAGEINRKIMKKMFEQMGKEAAGQGKKIQDLFSTKISNIGDAWTLFADSVMTMKVFDKPLFSEIKDDLDKVLGFLKTGLDGEKGEQFAKTLMDIYKASKVLIFQGLIPVGTEVAKLAATLTSLVGGPANALRLILAIMAAPLLGSIFTATVAVTEFAIAFAGLVASEGILTAIGAALMALVGGPIGAVVAGVGLVAGAAALVYSNWSAISDWLFGFWNKYGALIKICIFPLGLLIDGADALLVAFKALADADWFKNFWTGLVDWIKKAIAAMGDFFNGIVKGIDSFAAAARAVGLNRNLFTGQTINQEWVLSRGAQSGAPVSAERFLPLPIRPAIALPSKGAHSQQKDKLAINLHIDSEGRPRVKAFDYKGGKNVDFRASMGIMTPAFS